MARLKIRASTIRQLFSSSGNQCAFPGCTHELINHRHQFVAQVCHIYAASFGGERYNPDVSDDDLRLPENLLIMCYAHHVETNDVDAYPSERLKKIKLRHERQNAPLDFSVPKIALEEAIAQESAYWLKVRRANTIDHAFEELKFDVDPDASFYSATRQLREAISRLSVLVEAFRESDEKLPVDLCVLFERLGLNTNPLDELPCYENSFEQRNWEYHNIGVPNWSREIEIRLLQIEIRHYEILARTVDLSQRVEERIAEAKKKLLDMSRNELRVD